MSNEYDNNDYQDSDYRAYESFKPEKNSSKNRIRLNYHGGSCDILQYSMIYKISYDGNSNIYLVYSDGLYQITGLNLNGLVDALQSETIHSIFCIEEHQNASDKKPIVKMIEHLSATALSDE